MKSVKLARLMVLFATGAAIGMEPLSVDSRIGVYVVNKTAYEIKIQAEPDLMATQMGLEAFKEKAIPAGKSLYVSQLLQITDIKTSGPYAMGWTSNTGILNKIKQEAIAMKYKNADVYVHVVSSTVGYYIKDYHWAEEPKAEPSELTALVTLQDVVNGALESDYAQKVTTICKADYTVAEQRGASNLCLDLKRMFIAKGKSGGLSEEDAIARY